MSFTVSKNGRLALLNVATQVSVSGDNGIGDDELCSIDAQWCVCVFLISLGS